jgi:hypothetical protein
MHESRVEKIKKLNLEVIPYEEHIKKMVEAYTIHESNNWKAHSEAMKTIAEHPTTKIVRPSFVYLYATLLFLAVGCGIIVYLNKGAF